MSMTMLNIIAAIIVMVHCTCIIAKMNPGNWDGRRWQFMGMSAAYSFIAGGAIGIALGWHIGPTLLLVGLALMVLFDRRIRL